MRIDHCRLAAACLSAIAFVSSEALAQHPNDECSTAAPLVLGVNGPFDSTGSTVSAPAWGCGSVTGGDVWYSFATPAGLAGRLTIDTEGSTLADTVLQVFDACGGSSLACDDDGGTGLLSRISINVTGGTTYFARVGGFGSSFGVHNVNVTLVTPDECAGAIPVVDGLNGPFNTTGATTSTPQATCSPLNSDIWLVHTASCTGQLTINTESAGSSPLSDTVMEVWDACGGAVLACDDDGGPGLFSQVSIAVTAGSQYFIRVGDFGATSIAQGVFNLRIVNAPAPGGFPNECACAGSLALGANPVDTTGSTVSSPPWSCGLVSGGDTWYAYTAAGPGCVDVTIDTIGSGVDTVLQVWDACGGTVLACNDDVNFPPGESRVVLTALNAGTSIRVRAARFGSARGAFTINVSEAPSAPANDDCAGAIAVALGQNGPFSTRCATTSTPAWPCGAGGSDLWFTFTATCTAPHTFRTCASSYDTVLEVFDGACGALVSLGCNDDDPTGCSGNSLRSSLTVSLTNGSTYYVRIGGFGGARGDASLEVMTGTNTGTLTLSHASTCDGALTLAVTGNPNIGGTVSMAVTGDTGIPFCMMAFPPVNTTALSVPCGAGCHFIGLNGRDVTFGTSRNLTIPCNAVFLGATLDMQTLEILPTTPSCTTSGLGLNLSDIFTLVIG